MPSDRGPQRWFFDVWSRVYDAAFAQRFTYRPVHDSVVRQIGADSPPRRVLDIGCGTGILAARLVASVGAAEVIGCDFSRGMLARATERASDVDWVQGDAQRLPFESASVDVVTCTESFHWYPDPEAALAEFGRVLRPGGTLYVALVNTRARVLSELTGLGFRLAGQPLMWPTLDEMRERITVSGFRVTRQERVTRFPPGVLFPTILTTAVRVSA